MLLIKQNLDYGGFMGKPYKFAKKRVTRLFHIPVDLFEDIEEYRDLHIMLKSVMRN